MKKYTVIYDDGFMSGSHRVSITRMDRIETESLDNDLDKYDSGIWFIFEGWPKLEGDFNTEKEDNDKP